MSMLTVILVILQQGCPQMRDWGIDPPSVKFKHLKGSTG